MANRIKLAGTTLDQFEIGLSGVTLTANNVTTAYTLDLPANVGSNNQVLITDGTGNLSWANQTGGINSIIANGTSNVTIPVANGDILGYRGGNLALAITANSVAVGVLAGNSSQGNNSVAIGERAGSTTQGNNSVAVGRIAGQTNQGSLSVAIGTSAGSNAQGSSSISIGHLAGLSEQGTSSIAIGPSAGFARQGNLAIAIGSGSGGNGGNGPGQRVGSIAVGAGAGAANLGAYSIAIGYLAGNTNQANNSIILNSTGAELNQTTPNTFTVKPIRQANVSNVLYYNPTSGEITYDIATGGGGTPGGSNTQLQFNDAGTFGGSANLTFDKTTNSVTLNGDMTVGNIVSVDSVTLDTVNSTAGAVGRFTWNDGDGTADLGLKGGNVTLRVGQQEYAMAYNAEANTLVKGEVVYIFGAQGNRISVKRAQANVEATSFGTIGIVAESISNGGEGLIQTTGAMYNLTTTGLTAGNAIYLSPTVAGGYTTTKPVAPNQLVVLGWVERVHASAGSIYIKIDNGYELDELHDVLITSPANNQSLVYQNGLWVNQFVSTVANGNSNVNIPTANGNITVSAGGANTMTITSSNVIIGTGLNGIISAGVGNFSGNVTANYFLGNGSLLTGLSTTSISNGNSNVRVFANSNVTISSTGNANIVVVTGTGVNVAGTLNVTGITTINGNANLRISGGSNGQVLTTDGSSNLRWANAGNATALVNGNSNVIVTANGNVTVSVTGISNVATFSNVNTVFGSNGNGGNLTGANVISANTANITTINITGNIGNANVVTANTVTVNNFLKVGVYTAAALTAITGVVGQLASVSNSAGDGHPNGMLAFWDTTNSRWSYVHDNSAV